MRGRAVTCAGAEDERRHLGLVSDIARGKKSLKVDLKSQKGLDLFLKLADEADVIVEAFRPGVAKRLGIDYETISARNPRVVYCAISAFGQSGPYRDRPAHDLAVQALAGTVDLCAD